MSNNNERNKKNTEVKMPNQQALPSNVDMEKNFLSFILTDNNIIADTRNILTEDDFYHAKHRELYSSFMEMYTEQELTADLNLLSKSLVNRGVFNSGDEAKIFINELLDPNIMANHMYAEQYAEEIHELAMQRKLIKTSWEVPYILDKAQRGEIDMDQAVNEIEARMFAVTQEDKGKKRGLVEIGNCLDDFDSRLDNLSNGEIMPNGTPSGIESLDNIISGFKPGDLVILAARPAQGKSALVLNMAHHVAGVSKMPVAFYSLEMSAEQLTDRLISSVARVNLKEFNSLYYRYNDGGYEDAATKRNVKERLVKETKRLKEAKEYVKTLPILIEDNPAVTLLDITASARRLSMECTRRYGAPLGMIVIDYLQLMTPSSKNKGASREQEVAEMSRGLKILAKELNVPILALSQLSRQVESRADKRPQLSDLRESGSIEQDADIVMFIYRPHAGARAMGADDEDEVKCKKLQGEVVVSKHRSGPTGEAHVIIDDNFTRFGSIPARVRVIGIEAYIKEYYENVYKRGNLYFGVPENEIILEEFKHQGEYSQGDNSFITEEQVFEQVHEEVQDKNMDSLTVKNNNVEQYFEEDEEDEYFQNILQNKKNTNLLTDFTD